MKPDDISANYAKKRVGLTVRLLEEEDDGPLSMVLIEGKPAALRMLAELLLAIAEETMAKVASLELKSSTRARSCQPRCSKKGKK